MHKLVLGGMFLFITPTFLLFPCVLHGTVTIASWGAADLWPSIRVTLGGSAQDFVSFCRLRPACGEVLPPARNLCGFTVLPSV